MGTCCSRDLGLHETVVAADVAEEKGYEVIHEEDDDFIVADFGARVRLHGASRYVSMYSQQGRKGINQDAMTVWEEFIGDKDTFFCGVFDGHGPYGHKVARYVRDNLPSKLSTAVKLPESNSFKYYTGIDEDDRKEAGEDDDNNENIPSVSLWQAGFLRAFEEMDQELSLDGSIDSFCSGSTAVTLVKQGDHLIIANLGDSRAILCTRDNRNQLIPVQLTVDLKPNLASEAERIRSCHGRIFALNEEPDVFRIWMPDQDCPGLAMARAFGDFCLKEYGLISVPDVSYRSITNRDEFVVMATDGIWDVLSNNDVIKIVASATQRSMAAKMLVKHAVRAWRNRRPGSKVDDCAAVCLFLKNKTMLPRSCSEVSRVSADHTILTENYSEVSRASVNRSEIAAVPHKYISENVMIPGEESSSLEDRNRVNSSTKFSRFSDDLSRRKSIKNFQYVVA